MLWLFQNRIAFAMILAATIISAGLFAFYVLDLGYSPRSYAQIIASPTPTRGPETPTRAARPTSIPITLSPLPTTPPLAFGDNFADSRNFALAENIQARAIISNSHYILGFSQPATAYALLQTYAIHGDDFSVQVDARAGSFSRIEYGLLVWHGVSPQTQDERFIYFIVSPNGSFRVLARYSPDRATELIPPTFKSVIRSGIQTNTLRVDGHGNSLVFLINGSIVSDRYVSEFITYRSALQSDGKVGLVAVAGFANLDALFANFRLFAR